MSDQSGTQTHVIQGPSIKDTAGWKAYWQAQGQPWRTQQEIDTKRQEYLAQRRHLPPNIQQGIYSDYRLYE